MDNSHVERPAASRGGDLETEGLGAEVRASALLVALAVLATVGLALLAHVLLRSGS